MTTAPRTTVMGRKARSARERTVESEDSRWMRPRASAAWPRSAAREQTHCQRICGSRCPMAISRRREAFSKGAWSRCATSSLGPWVIFSLVPGHGSCGVLFCIPDPERYCSRIMTIILPTSALPDCNPILLLHHLNHSMQVDGFGENADTAESVWRFQFSSAGAVA